MLTFANPLFLFALAGLAAPVLAHLINRERAQPLKFPSIRFITLARLPQEGKRSLRDKLLLLLRMLLFACIVVALAGPRWQSPVAAEPAVAADAVEPTIFVVDLSASMQGWSTWDALQTQVAERMQALDAAQPIGLVLYANEVLETFPPSVDRSLVRDMIASEWPRPYRGHPAPAIREALAQLAGADKGRILIVSDFQVTDWQINRWPSVPDNIAVEFLNPADFNTANLAILQAQAFPASEDRIRVVGKIRNFSPASQQVTIKLASTTELGAEQVSLAPGQVQPFNFIVDTPQQLAGKLTIGEDAYAPDNAYALWLGPPPPTRMLAIIPLLQEPERLAEVEFVGKALEATTEASVRTYQLVGVNTDTDLAAAGITSPAAEGDASNPVTAGADESPLSNAGRPNVVYLPGSGGYLHDAQWQRLSAYVQEGGTLLITPGKGAAKLFRQLREHEISQIGYLGQPGRERDRRNPHRIGWLNPDSNLGKIFNDDSLRDVYLTEIYQFIRLRPGKATEVLMKTEKDEPLLLRESVGAGTLIVSAFSWDALASDLPLRQSFLPIVRELLEVAAPREGGIVRVECGDAIPSSFASYGLDPVTLAIDRYTAEPGVFKLSNLPVEVNVARTESIPEQAVLADIRANLMAVSPTVDAASPTAAASVPTASRQPIDYWTWFAIAGFLLLIAETVMTNRLDHRFRPHHART